MNTHPQRSWTLPGAADLVLKLAAAGGVLTAGFLWLIEPRIKPFTQVIQTVEGITNTLDRVSTQMVAMTERIERLELRGDVNQAPPLIFLKVGNAIGDGEPGGTVVMRWHYNKQRDCGAPMVDAFFEVPVRGASEQPVTLRFLNVGIATPNGRGIVLADGPGTIAFPVTIPDRVPAGDAEGWVTHSYPDCPLVGPTISPRVPFRILSRMTMPGHERSETDWGLDDDPPEAVDRG